MGAAQSGSQRNEVGVELLFDVIEASWYRSILGIPEALTCTGFCYPFRS
jgi:hypothetical protein